MVRRGDAVLWIHGYTLDSSIWEPLCQGLPRYRHVGVDLPGHGSSPRPVAQTDLPALARHIARLAQDQEARHLVGLSFGGLIALQVAIAAPVAFATLTLSGAPIGGGPSDPDAEARNRELKRLYDERGAGPWMTELWMRWPPDIFRGASRHPELWERLRAAVDRHHWDELAGTGMRWLTDHVQPPTALRRVAAATLLLVGENDMPFAKRSAELIRRTIPVVRRVYVPDAGHLALLESPQAAQLVAAHLRAAGS
jgi:pimeloyl-ACP methyl ester carboxylesterase